MGGVLLLPRISPLCPTGRLARRLDLVPCGSDYRSRRCAGTNALIVFGVAPDFRNTIIFGTLVVALFLILIVRPTFYIKSTPSLVFWVPFLIHTYTLLAGLTSGVILNPPFLLWISLAMFGTALYLHRATVRSILFKVKPAD